MSSSPAAVEQEPTSVTDVPRYKPTYYRAYAHTSVFFAIIPFIISLAVDQGWKSYWLFVIFPVMTIVHHVLLLLAGEKYGISIARMPRFRVYIALAFFICLGWLSASIITVVNIILMYTGPTEDIFGLGKTIGIAFEVQFGLFELLLVGLVAVRGLKERKQRLAIPDEESSHGSVEEEPEMREARIPTPTPNPPPAPATQ